MARFANLWSAWIAAAAALALVSLALVATNIDANGSAFVWGVALAPLYVLVGAGFCAACAVCVAHREALADDRDDALARERAASFAEAAPAIAWSCVFLALVLATLIVTNVRADSVTTSALSSLASSSSLALSSSPTSSSSLALSSSSTSSLALSSSNSSLVSSSATLAADNATTSDDVASASKRAFEDASATTTTTNAVLLTNASAVLLTNASANAEAATHAGVAFDEANHNDDEHRAQWTAAIALALVVEFFVVFYCVASACARQWSARRGEPPALWTRPIDAAVCCWSPGADYDDDSRAMPAPPQRVADEASDAPLYAYECGGSVIEHARCCASYGGASSAADGALVALGVVGCVALGALIIGTGLLVPFDDGRIEHRWPLFLSWWLVAPVVLALLLVVACRAGSLSRHRYAQWSTFVALLFVVGLVATTITVAATSSTSTTSAHVVVAPLYAALALVATFHCCAAMVGARTGLLQARHDYHHLGRAGASTHVQEKLHARRPAPVAASFISPSLRLT